MAFRASVTLLIALGATGLLLAALLPGRERRGQQAAPTAPC
jgi:hypothetical protein